MIKIIKEEINDLRYDLNNKDNEVNCQLKCNLDDESIQLRDNRVPCIYRMSKIDNLKIAMDLFNDQSDKIKWWTKTEKSQKSKKNKENVKN